MKLAKLSLAAMVVAGLATSSFAADTLADAFAKGKVSGELRAWYFDRDFKNAMGAAAPSTGSADIFNTGLVLNYVTDQFFGFYMGATMQSSYAPFADADAKTLYRNDMYGSGAVLSEAYLGYKMKNTDVKVGRMYLATPLVAGSGTRMIKQAFEGALVVNTDLPQTTLAAGAVTKYQQRTSNNANFSGDPAVSIGDIAEFKALTANHDYLYTLLAINKSIPGLTVTGQWAQVENVLNNYFVEANYAGKVGEFTYGLTGNYLYSDLDVATATGDSATMYGAKIDFGFGAFKSFVAYSVITDDNTLTPGVGSGAQPALAKGYQFQAGTYDRDSQTYAIDANYNFASIGLLVGARYTEAQIDSALAAADEKSYTDIYAVYNFSGALKGLSFDVSYEDMGKDLDNKETWFKANYKF